MDDLERLLAERACERLIVEYCRLVDFGEAARIADLFTEDGVWSGVDLVLDGREEIRAWFVKRQGLERRVSRHICTNIGVDVLSPDEARSVCYLVNYRHDRRAGDETSPSRPRSRSSSASAATPSAAPTAAGASPGATSTSRSSDAGHDAAVDRDRRARDVRGGVAE